MSSPKPNWVDVSNQAGYKSIIWQYDKESENSECQLCKEKGVLYTKGCTKSALDSSTNAFITVKLKYCWNYWMLLFRD